MVIAVEIVEIRPNGKPVGETKEGAMYVVEDAPKLKVGDTAELVLDDAGVARIKK